MSAHTVVAIKGSRNLAGAMKMVAITFTGSASYDAGGSAIDLSTSGVLGVDGFATVYGVAQIGCSASTSGKYRLTFLPAASDAAATGKIYITDIEQATPAEVSGNLSTTTFRVIVYGT
jgi:hypothetical protein